MEHTLFKTEKFEHVTCISNFSNMKMVFFHKPQRRKRKLIPYLVIFKNSYVSVEHEIDFTKTYISFEE